MTPQQSAFEDEPTSPDHERPASAGTFELAQQIDRLKKGPQYVTTGHAAQTLVKRPDLRVVLIVLSRDAELKQHQTNQPVSIQTLVGRIRISLPERSVEQGPGSLIVIEPGISHDVSALADSAFLLSMPWSDPPRGDASRQERPIGCA